jgi:hypothetical protein
MQKVTEVMKLGTEMRNVEDEKKDSVKNFVVFESLNKISCIFASQKIINMDTEIIDNLIDNFKYMASEKHNHICGIIDKIKNTK